ncbi:hypothetical protein D3C84_1173020 [compost metagenome]
MGSKQTSHIGQPLDLFIGVDIPLGAIEEETNLQRQRTGADPRLMEALFSINTALQVIPIHHHYFLVR